MIVALDVHYMGTEAHAAAIAFSGWQSADCVASYTATESPVGPYEPGKFYLRELSPLLRVIRRIECDVGTFVIDEVMPPVCLMT